MVSGLVYFLHLDDVLLIPETLEAMDMSVLKEKFVAEVSTEYTLIENMQNVLRYRYHFSAVLKKAVKTVDLTTIETNLLTAWKQQRTGIQ